MSRGEGLPRLSDLREAIGHVVHSLSDVAGELKAELVAVQKELAREAGLAVEDASGVLAVAPTGGHWLNRWAAGLQRNMGVRVYWSPLHNHAGGHGASYDPKGWIMSDDLGPLLSRPSVEFFHEFLHAYADRGRHAEKFKFLRTDFRKDGWASFPRAESYPNAGYARSEEFQADEIMTNLHTVYDRARRIAEGYGKSEGDWSASALKDAPPEVRSLIDGIDTPMFLSESVREMAASLLPGVLRIAQRGLRGQSLKKNYGPYNGSIPRTGEYEENEKKDLGFYELIVKDSAAPMRVRYLTRGHFQTAEAKSSRVFPVFFGNGKFSARVKLERSEAEKADLDDPEHQEIMVAAAARLLAPKLAHLHDVNALLAPSLKHLRALQARARTRVDLALVREIQETSREAFFLVARYFIGQPDPQRSDPRGVAKE